MSDDTIQVSVMQWTTNSKEEEESGMQRVKSFSRIRRLEIRWTASMAANSSRVDVPINSVPMILGAVISHHVTIEALLVDLQCLSRDTISSSFCNSLLSSNAYPRLQKLTVTCSGQEDMSKQALRDLGKTFRSLCSVQTLKLSSMDPEHLAVVLQNMQTPKTCSEGGQEPIPAPACKKPRLSLSGSNLCDKNTSTDAVNKRLNGYPTNLEIERSRLFHKAIGHLVNLVMDDDQSSIAHLALRDCVYYAEDLESLSFLLKGQSILSELSLERLRICFFPGALSPLWGAVSQQLVNPISTHLLASRSRLSTVRLLDCKASRGDLETLTKSLVQNRRMERLVVQHCTPDTCPTTIHALDALHNSTVIHDNACCSLKELQIRMGPQMEPYRLQQLVALLRHPKCKLESLSLDLGAGPYKLDSLTAGFANNDILRLNHLFLSGEDELDTTTLEQFVEALGSSSNLKSLRLGFPGTHEANDDVVRIFHANKTLESIRVNPAPRAFYSPTDLSYFGLRNQVCQLLTARCWTVGTWQEVLQLLLNWYDSPSVDAVARLGAHGMDLVYVSAIWLALMECPSLVSELGPMEHAF